MTPLRFSGIRTAQRDPTIAGGVPRAAVVLDPLEEALVDLARSALRNRRDVAEQRGKMTIVEGDKEGGRTG